MLTDKEIDAILRRAPMGSAPMKYLEDGAVNWGEMWESYCVLAQEGGPPHRAEMLAAEDKVDSESEGYQFATREIIRGILAVSGLKASAASPGWIQVECLSESMADWLAEAITQENVQARREGSQLLLPVAEYYTLKGEIKNIITVVAKTTHYWIEHLPIEVKQTIAVQLKIEAVKSKVTSWFRRR